MVIFGFDYGRFILAKKILSASPTPWVCVCIED